MRQRRLSYRYTMVVTSSQPSSFMEALHGERPGVVLSQTCWTPPTDIYETSKSIIVTVELAGIEEEQLEVLLYENALVMEGRRRLPPVEPDGVYRVAQIRQGPFRIEVALAIPIDADRVESSYDRGLLRVVLPKVNGR